ncbi:MAG: hypothetical protein AAGK78_12305 [Planctomycetota bacterium]
MSDAPKTPASDGAAQDIPGADAKRRNQRNLAIALMITAFVVLIYVVTILRLGGSVAERAF